METVSFTQQQQQVVVCVCVGEECACRTCVEVIQYLLVTVHDRFLEARLAFFINRLDISIRTSVHIDYKILLLNNPSYCNLYIYIFIYI